MRLGERGLFHKAFKGHRHHGTAGGGAP